MWLARVWFREDIQERGSERTFRSVVQRGHSGAWFREDIHECGSERTSGEVVLFYFFLNVYWEEKVLVCNAPYFSI
jgi:hypothetical protein